MHRVSRWVLKKEVGISAHSGSRPGAGRPVTGRKQQKLQATDEEWGLIKKYTDEVRGK